MASTEEPVSSSAALPTIGDADGAWTDSERMDLFAVHYRKRESHYAFFCNGDAIVPQKCVKSGCLNFEDARRAAYERPFLGGSWRVERTVTVRGAGGQHRHVVGCPPGVVTTQRGADGPVQQTGHMYDCDAVSSVVVESDRPITVKLTWGCKGRDDKRRMQRSLPYTGPCTRHQLDDTIYIIGANFTPATMLTTQTIGPYDTVVKIVEEHVVYCDAVRDFLMATPFESIVLGTLTRHSHGTVGPLYVQKVQRCAGAEDGGSATNGEDETRASQQP